MGKAVQNSNGENKKTRVQSPFHLEHWKTYWAHYFLETIYGNKEMEGNMRKKEKEPR